MKIIITFFTTIFVTLSLHFTTVYLVDPYDIYQNNFFNFSTKAVSFSRENKFNLYKYRKKEYPIITIGSSTSFRYHHDLILKITGKEAFNYSVHSATIEDMYAIFNHVTQTSKPEYIILNLSFIDLSIHHPVEAQLLTSPLKDYLYNKNISTRKDSHSYFTLNAFFDSLNIFYVNIFGEPKHSYDLNGDIPIDNHQNEKVKMFQSDYALDYTFSPERILLLKKIVSKAKARNIKLKVILSPLYLKHLNKIIKEPFLAKVHKQYKLEIKKIFHHFYDFQTKQIKAFSNARYFIDSNHPSLELSEIVLRDVFRKDTDFTLAVKR